MRLLRLTTEISSDIHFRRYCTLVKHTPIATNTHMIKQYVPLEIITTYDVHTNGRQIPPTTLNLYVQMKNVTILSYQSSHHVESQFLENEVIFKHKLPEYCGIRKEFVIQIRRSLYLDLTHLF